MPSAAERREYLRLYREQNKERIAASKKAWYEKNREHVITKRKENYERHRQERIDYSVQWNRNHTERRKAITKSHKHRRRDLTNTFDAMVLDFIEQCPPGYHVDHIMPLALGGRHELANLQHLKACLNLQKNATHPDDWPDPRPIRCRP